MRPIRQPSVNICNTRHNINNIIILFITFSHYILLLSATFLEPTVIPIAQA